MSTWTSSAPVPNKPTVSVDVKQHFNINLTRFDQITRKGLTNASPLTSDSAEDCE